MTAPVVKLIQGDARKLDGLADGSVNLIVTSPPYAGQRVYMDNGEPLEGQIGAEPHPQQYLENLWACCKEWWRVLADDGSLFVNLADKRAGSGGGNDNTGLGNKRGSQTEGTDRFSSPRRYSRGNFGRPKSRQMIPERFAIGCEDGLADPDGVGWIVRQIIIWWKASCLPESVLDRSRDDYETIVHLVKSERYYSAVDELREPFIEGWGDPNRIRGRRNVKPDGTSDGGMVERPNFLGRLPGSVWRIASDPLRIPQWASEKFNLPVHFAAFPTEIPRRLILGWSSPAVCLICGEGRWPVVDRRFDGEPNHAEAERQQLRSAQSDAGSPTGSGRTELLRRSIEGYACRCAPNHTELETTFTHDHEGCDGTVLVPTGEVDIWGDDRLEEQDCTDPAHMTAISRNVTIYDLAGWTPPPSRPAVVFDPFCGTGTTCLVAQALGRDSVGVDLSNDYLRLAEWRCSQPQRAAKAKARSWSEAQGVLL